MKELNIKTPTAEEQQAAHERYMNYLRNNPNNFSYWFPHIEKLTKEGISIPKSITLPISEKLYNSFFAEKEAESDEERVDKWVLEQLVPAVTEAFPGMKKFFIKNGCFSNKFRFSKNCLIEDINDEETLIRHICSIQYDSLCCETDGNLEMVIREYIEPTSGTPTIYQGMPLRPELRLFYNFDSHQILYAVNYWDWDYCHEGICFYPFGTERTPDADIYEAAYPQLNADTWRLYNKHRQTIIKALSTVTTLQMPGKNPNIWSVDFMLEENHLWLIDMAQGWRSAYWDYKRAGL